MAQYVDGFVIPIKKKNLVKYKKDALLGRKTWMKFGALHYYETVGDDMNLPYGCTFPKMCKTKSDETVIFAFIVFKSKAHRNQVNKKVMAYFSSLKGKHDMPFDIKRAAIGGFKSIVNSK